VANTKKKRLPVLANTPEDEQGEAPRPPWQWAGFGVAAMFGACVPLQYAAEALTLRIMHAWIGDPDSPEATAAALALLSSGERAKVWTAVVGIRALPLLVSSLFGGYVVGRWGGDNAGVREAAIAGVAVTIIVSVLGFAVVGLAAWWTPVPLLLLTVPAAAWGGKLGKTRRIKAMTPNLL
jgi:hypothetical protein